MNMRNAEESVVRVCKCRLHESSLFQSEFRAAYMYVLQVWNNALQNTAQNWAENCVFGYNSNRNTETPDFTSVGENVWATSSGRYMCM